jgi:hypothetical protein
MGRGRTDAAGLFVSREAAATMLHLSIGGLSSAMERGELEGLYLRCGRSIRFCLPALELRALGVTDTGAFVKSLGVDSLGDLVKFLGDRTELAP